MDIKKILEYQEKDKKVINLERELDSSEDKKIYQSMQNVAKDAQARSASLDKSAEDVVREYNNLKKAFDDNQKLLDNLEKKDLTNLDENGIKELKELTNKIISNLNYLEKKIMAQADAVKKILDEFDNTKKRYNAAKTKHTEHKQKFEAEKAKLEPEIEKAQAELAELEKGIDKDLLARYKAKRTDKFFPIFVPLRGSSCGGCMMELSVAQIEKLKKNGILECENCRRYIYLDENK